MNSHISRTVDWEESRQRITGSHNYPLVASLLLLPFVAFSIFSIYRGYYANLWFFIPAAVCIAGLIGQSNTVRHRRWRFMPEPSGITVADHSTLFDTAEEFKRWANVAIFSGVFTGTATVIGFMNGTFEYLSRGRSSPISGVIMAGGFAAVLCGRAILLRTGHQRHLAVRCDPDTLTFVKMFHEWTIRWEDIDHIEAHTEARGTRNCALRVSPRQEGHIEARLHQVIPFIDSASQPSGRAMEIKADLLEVGAEPLRWFLQHYLEHPEHRPELADERARQRLLSAPVAAV